MLLVNTYLDKSDIEGIGLFASNSIKKGDIVWKYNEITTIKWTDKQWKKIKGALDLSAFANIERFAYCRYGEWHLNLDDSRFMNHSTLANLGYDQTEDYCYALVDISAGEELTCNYFEFCEEIDMRYMNKDVDTKIHNYRTEDSRLKRAVIKLAPIIFTVITMIFFLIAFLIPNKYLYWYMYCESLFYSISYLLFWHITEHSKN